MAIVNVDLSEYDMLRESKKKAEDQIIELKSEIEEYKKHARVIVTTKKCFRTLDAKKVADLAAKYYSQDPYTYTGITVTNPYGNTYDRSNKTFQRGEDTLKHAIECAIRECDTSDAYIPFVTSFDKLESSTEIKGFEDVRLKVEEHLKEEYKAELQSKQIELEKAIKQYKEKYDNVYQGLQIIFDSKLNLAKKESSLELATKETQLKKSMIKISELQDSLDNLKEELTKVKEQARCTENYKAAANKFELENISLKKELEELQHSNKVLESKLKDKPRWKIFC